MDAKELYELSYAAANPTNEQQYVEGLKVRIYRCLKRAGYMLLDNSILDKDRIMEDVTNGSIFHVRNIGEKSVMDICKWLLGEE